MLLEQIQTPEESLVAWINHSLLKNKIQNAYVSTLEELSSNLPKMAGIISVLEPTLKGSLQDVIKALEEKGVEHDLSPAHITAKFNKVPVYLFLDSIKRLHAVPRQHLINWVNSLVARQDVPRITNLGADLSNGVVIVRLLNALYPEKYDLAPLKIVSNAERIKAVVEYCKYAELEHIVDQKALQEGIEAKLGLAIEVLYQ